MGPALPSVHHSETFESFLSINQIRLTHTALFGAKSCSLSYHPHYTTQATMAKNKVNISHLAQDLQPGLSRADFYRLEFSFLPKTRVQSLSIIASAFVKSHPCRILQAFPVSQVAEGYARNTTGTWASEFIYDNGI